MGGVSIFFSGNLRGRRGVKRGRRATIQGDDGKKYDPGSSPPAEYRKEGLRVKFEAVEVKDVVTIRMGGTLVRILKIEKIEKK